MCTSITVSEEMYHTVATQAPSQANAFLETLLYESDLSLKIELIKGCPIFRELNDDWISTVTSPVKLAQFMAVDAITEAYLRILSTTYGLAWLPRESTRQQRTELFKQVRRVSYARLNRRRIYEPNDQRTLGCVAHGSRSHSSRGQVAPRSRRGSSGHRSHKLSAI